MVDREKVIKGLEICSAGEWNSTGGRDHTSCPYYPAGYTGCTCKLLMRDALTLLKEQETEWEHLWDAPDGTFKGRCKKCGFVHFFIERHDEQYNFCPACGKAVKWDAAD